MRKYLSYRNQSYYGGGGRAENILSFMKIGLKEIEYVVDINPEKQGQYIPPYGQKIILPITINNVKPKTIIIANGKYKNEISKMAPADCLVVAIDDL